MLFFSHNILLLRICLYCLCSFIAQTKQLYQLFCYRQSLSRRHASVLFSTSPLPTFGCVGSATLASLCERRGWPRTEQSPWYFVAAASVVITNDSSMCDSDLASDNKFPVNLNEERAQANFRQTGF